MDQVVACEIANGSHDLNDCTLPQTIRVLSTAILRLHFASSELLYQRVPNREIRTNSDRHVSVAQVRNECRTTDGRCRSNGLDPDKVLARGRNSLQCDFEDCDTEVAIEGNTVSLDMEDVGIVSSALLKLAESEERTGNERG